MPGFRSLRTIFVYNFGREETNRGEGVTILSTFKWPDFWKGFTFVIIKSNHYAIRN